MREDGLDMRKIVGENIKIYIEALGRTHAWVMSRANIPKSTYYKLLNGEGDLEKSIEKITKLFGIDNLFYFHDIDFVPPKTIEQIRAESDIKNLAAANYVAVEGEEQEINSTMEMLNDFINMIELLKRNNATANFNPIIEYQSDKELLN